MMSAVEPLYKLLNTNTNTKKLTRVENEVLEVGLFLHMYQELTELFRIDAKKYFELMKFDKEKEDSMLESNFIRNIIRDVVSIGEYSLEGIAHSTNIPEEVVIEMALGRNDNPSLYVSRKLMELHKSIRVDLYRGILNRVLENKSDDA